LEELKDIPGVSLKMKDNSVLVISLPPFNRLGLSRFLENNKIRYVALEDALLEIIRASTNRIYISSPFLEIGTISSIKEALLEKAKKVKIKILVRQIKNQNNLREKSIRKFLNEARELGVENNLEIKDYYFSLKNKKLLSSIHAKFVIVDGKTMYLGSGELRKNSFKKNFEVGLLTKESESIKALESLFLEIFHASENLK
jgi:phosphatidylserine/phosphatidylglycerophosphate/cardiolipin synthase-like enzyme